MIAPCLSRDDMDLVCCGSDDRHHEGHRVVEGYGISDGLIRSPPRRGPSGIIMFYQLDVQDSMHQEMVCSSRQRLSIFINVALIDCNLMTENSQEYVST